MVETKKKHNDAKDIKDSKPGENYKMIGSALVLIGILGSLVVFIQSSSPSISAFLGVYILVGCLLSSALFFAIGKIIELLSEISNQLDFVINEQNNIK